jgi:hypothetical protein
MSATSSTRRVSAATLFVYEAKPWPMRTYPSSRSHIGQSGALADVQLRSLWLAP